MAVIPTARYVPIPNAEPYLTMFDGSEMPGRLQDTSFSVFITAGKTFAAGDTITLRWSTNPDLSGSSTSSSSLAAVSQYNAVRLDATGLTVSTLYYWRIEIFIQATGLTHNGLIRETRTQRAKDDPAGSLFLITSDEHPLPRVVNGHTNAMAVLEQGHINLASEEAPGGGPPDLRIDLGDTVPYVKFGTGNIFPIEETGLPTGGADRPYGKSQQDADRAARVYRRLFKQSTHTAPHLFVAGNHDGPHWWHFSANTGLGNNLAAWRLQTLNNYLGHPVINGIYSGDAGAKYFAFRVGPVLHCVFDPYFATQLSITVPADPTLPKQPDSPNDWTLGQAQWDFFFHSATGVIATANPANTPWIACYIHHLVGGNLIQAGEAYGRGGKPYLVAKSGLGVDQLSREHGADPAWTNPYGYTGDYAALGVHQALVKAEKTTGCRIVVFKGHDHFGDLGWVDGVPYITCLRMSDENTSPYGYGFADEGGYRSSGVWVDTDTNARHSANAGYLRVHATMTEFRVQVRRIYVPGLGVPDPDDGGNQNYIITELLWLRQSLAPLKRVSDTFVRTPDDTTTTEPPNAGSAQQAIKTGEPVGVRTQDGDLWELGNNGSGNNAVNLSIRGSLVDGSACLCTRRPGTAGATIVRQWARMHLGPRVDRRIKVKPRRSGGTTVFYLLLASPRRNNLGVVPAYTTGVVGKGLVISLGAGVPSLVWDDGVTQTTLASGILAYTIPSVAFDGGIDIVWRGRRVVGYFSYGGQMVRMLDYRFPWSSAGVKIYETILKGTGLFHAEDSYRLVGVSAGANNITGQGYEISFKDFQAESLPPIVRPRYQERHGSRSGRPSKTWLGR